MPLKACWWKASGTMVSPATPEAYEHAGWSAMKFFGQCVRRTRTAAFHGCQMPHCGTLRSLRQSGRHIPLETFDPRFAVCGFDAAGVVEADNTLGLRRRHKALYTVLVGFFGPYGCHPSQESIADSMGIFQQQVSREVKHLVRAGSVANSRMLRSFRSIRVARFFSNSEANCRSL